MSDEINCPFCDTPISEDTEKCPGCGTSFDMSGEDAEEPSDSTEADSIEGGEDFDIEAIDDEMTEVEGEDFDIEAVDDEMAEVEVQPVDDDAQDLDMEAVDDEAEAIDAQDFDVEAIDDEAQDFDVEAIDDEAQDFDVEAIDNEAIDMAPEEGGDGPEDFDIEATDDEEGGEFEGEPDFEALARESMEEEEEDTTPAITPQRTTEKAHKEVSPLPEPGEHPIAPSLIIYRDQKRVDIVDIETEVTLFGAGTGKDQPPSAQAEISPLDEEPGGDDFEEEADLEVADAELMADDGDEMPFDVEAVDDDGGEDDGEAETVEEEAVLDVAETPERDSTSHVDLSAYLEEFDATKHIAIYRQNKNYTLYVLADEATQVNDQLLELGDYVRLNDGDIIILGEKLGLQFSLAA